MTELDYIRFLDRHPELTTHGFGVDRDQIYDVKILHEELKNYYDVFSLCVDMLKNCYDIAAGKKNEMDSYSLKHKAEKYIDKVLHKAMYVPEGVLVAAVVFLFSSYKRSKRGTGILIGLKAVPIV